MATPFQQRKAGLAFYRWDQTKDGVVRAGDLELWGKEVAAHLNITQGSPHYDKILRATPNTTSPTTRMLASSRRLPMTCTPLGTHAAPLAYHEGHHV